MIELSVIVPIRNEQADLWRSMSELATHLDRIIGAGAWQLVLVDNGSNDQSAEIISRIIESWPASIRLYVPKPDYGETLAQGLGNAQGKWVYVINVDFWDEVFLAWCWHCRGAYDLVLGSKSADPSLNKQHFYRRLLTWGLNALLQFLCGVVTTDTHGQKFFNLAALRPILAECVMRRGQYDTEFTLRAMRRGLWVAEVPVPIVEVRAPRNLMLRKIALNIMDMFTLRRVMRDLPHESPLRYHRWAREDLEGALTPMRREVFGSTVRLVPNPERSEAKRVAASGADRSASP
jgi:glycosyltransferase involved in cell wall biosynthesis